MPSAKRIHQGLKYNIIFTAQQFDLKLLTSWSGISSSISGCQKKSSSEAGKWKEPKDSFGGLFQFDGTLGVEHCADLQLS